jgi:hypothetical protein
MIIQLPKRFNGVIDPDGAGKFWLEFEHSSTMFPFDARISCVGREASLLAAVVGGGWREPDVASVVIKTMPSFSTVLTWAFGFHGPCQVSGEVESFTPGVSAGM